jgi:hypothetical protein
MSNLIPMHTGLSGNGTVSVKGGGSQPYALNGGIVMVQPVDVPAALATGWRFHGSGTEAAYLAARIRLMNPPATSVLANNTVITFPDGQQATLTNGVLPVPQQWFNWMTEQLWSLAPGFPAS